VLISPGDPDALADAVNGLLADPDRRLRLARAAAAAAAGPYSWDEAARKTLELYRGLVYRRTVAAPQSAPS
jgi:glycosyltransferase involved in cell wall biosynthesis